MNDTVTVERVREQQASISGVNHVALPVRDRAEGFRFWNRIFGAELIVSADADNFTFLQMPGGFQLGLAEMPQDWEPLRPEEYPHLAFDVPPGMMDVLKDRLDYYGIPTHDIWTRFRTEALMYFRDPSGNLFELYCHEGYEKAGSIPVGSSYGGDFFPDLQALNYTVWNDPGE